MTLLWLMRIGSVFTACFCAYHAVATARQARAAAPNSDAAASLRSSANFYTVLAIVTAGLSAYTAWL